MWRQLKKFIIVKIIGILFLVKEIKNKPKNTILLYEMWSNNKLSNESKLTKKFKHMYLYIMCSHEYVLLDVWLKQDVIIKTLNLPIEKIYVCKRCGMHLGVSNAT